MGRFKIMDSKTLVGIFMAVFTIAVLASIVTAAIMLFAFGSTLETGIASQLSSLAIDCSETISEQAVTIKLGETTFYCVVS